MYKGDNKMNLKLSIIMVFALFISFNIFAEELPSEWEITMTYQGGYSPIKSGTIHIQKKASETTYTKRIEYYEEESLGPEEGSGTVPAERLVFLAEALQKYDAWSLGDLKEYVATDGFTFDIEIKESGRQHRFEVYFPELQKDQRYNRIVKAIHDAIE